MRASIELVCFDLDGTLVDSAPDICQALGVGLLAVGLGQPTEAQTRGWIGDGIDKLLLRALENAGVRDRDVFETALTAFHGHYREHLFARSSLYPGVVTALQTLAERGHRLSCITNKRTDYAASLLERAGIARRFEFIFGGDSFEQKKPHPRQLLEAAARASVNPQDCVMIGDADNDSSAAAAAGFRFIWAAFGYCSRLQTRDPEKLTAVDTFAEIPDALRSLMR